MDRIRVILVFLVVLILILFKFPPFFSSKGLFDFFFSFDRCISLIAVEEQLSNSETFSLVAFSLPSFLVSSPLSLLFLRTKGL